MLYFLDANIIIYAAGKEHPLKDSCQKIISLISENRVSVIINTEICQEILYRFSSIQMLDKGIELTTRIIDLVDTVLPINQIEIEEAMRIIKKYPAIDSRDAIHIASMLTYSIDKIISTDKHFDLASEIKRIDPLEIQNLT
jgi:predicted nucleic acid-binding protein